MPDSTFTVEFTWDELNTLIGAARAQEDEYGFAVYEERNDARPTGSYGPRTPAEHKAADERGRALLNRLEAVLRQSA